MMCSLKSKNSFCAVSTVSLDTAALCRCSWTAVSSDAWKSTNLLKTPRFYQNLLSSWPHRAQTHYWTLLSIILDKLFHSNFSCSVQQLHWFFSFWSILHNALHYTRLLQLSMKIFNLHFYADYNWNIGLNQAKISGKYWNKPVLNQTDNIFKIKKVKRTRKLEMSHNAFLGYQTISYSSRFD